MNPYYEAGVFCTGPACEPCHTKCGGSVCSGTCDGSCNKCEKQPCGRTEPVLGISKVLDKTATYRFNDNGKTTIWSFEDGILEGQTDTSLVADVVERVLRYSAERHTDTITAQELGSILHLTDIGDVSTKGAENGAMLVYKKTDTCPTGCYGVSNIWEPWNALDNLTASAAYAYGFDSNGLPVSLQQPQNPSQYYNLAWNGTNQLSYQQPVFETAPRLDSDGYAYLQYLDPGTKQPYYVKVKP